MTKITAREIARRISEENGSKLTPTTAGLSYTAPAPGDIGTYEARMIEGTAGSRTEVTRWASMINRELETIKDARIEAIRNGAH